MKRKYLMLIISATIIFALSVSYVYRNDLKRIYGYAHAAISYYGSSGQEVIDIQSKLSNWGYYDGAVDGGYGYKTYDAVRRFQYKNGLTVDGIAGPETLSALGLPSGTPASSTSGSTANNSDLNLLAHIISGEARGEPYIGQVAVGAVIINRTRDDRFPKSIAGVVYQPGAFDAVSDGQIDLAPSDSAYKAARDALNGWDPSGGAVYYFNPSTATSAWIWTRNIITTIGKHYFAK